MLQRDATGWTLDQQTYQVQQCLVDYAFGLRLDDVGPTRAESIFVRISAPFELSVDGEQYQLDAGAASRVVGTSPYPAQALWCHSSGERCGRPPRDLCRWRLPVGGAGSPL
jgi:hypothetical protein